MKKVSLSSLSIHREVLFAFEGSGYEAYLAYLFGSAVVDASYETVPPQSLSRRRNIPKGDERKTVSCSALGLPI